ncbi:MAG: LUD domain-containing protein [Candidatus Contendobacter sp.]|nr:LUD domain-containing protein [Candidatus Contendobacter sp.]
MSEIREQILATVRRGLQRGPLGEARRAELEARLAHPPRHLLPARAQGYHSEQVALLIKMAEYALATVDQVARMDDVPAAVAAFLARERLPTAVVMAPDAELAALPWENQPLLRIERRAARDGDKVSVTAAFAGIAETGTLMLRSGPDRPTTLNFLPDIHIVLLPAERIVGSYEDGWDLLRATGEAMPRTVNYITGPSRSGDIEQTMQLGAHGPLRLHIVLAGA